MIAPSITKRGPTDSYTGTPLGNNKFFFKNPIDQNQ
jgi:hypothetical protein